MRFANDIIIPEIKTLIDEGQTVTFTVRGRSMRPMIEGDRDSVVLVPCQGEIKKGDVILAEFAPQRYALHRIIGVDGDILTMRGDGNLIGTETFHRSKVVGRAEAFIRKGKRLSMQSRKWRIYSALWTRLLPLRRYLLFLCYPHVPGRVVGLLVRIKKNLGF